jgi:hypothetical protein
MSCIKFLSIFFAVFVTLFSIGVYQVFIKTEPSPIVQLKDGQVQGIVLHSRNGRAFHAFQGIPFAKPPLRFEVRCHVFVKFGKF